MADVSADKKLKLANTKKRFKELQELKKKRTEGGTSKVSLEHDYTDQSSGHSSNRATPVELNILETVLQTPDPISDVTIASLAQQLQEATTLNEESSLSSYFASPTPASTFFDNAVSKPDRNLPGVPVDTEKTREESQLLTYFDTEVTQVVNDDDVNENIGMAKYFDNTSPETAQASQGLSTDEYKLFPTETSPLPVIDQVINNDDHSTAQDYPEIQQSELQLKEYTRKPSLPVVHFQQDYNNVFSPTDNQKLFDYLGAAGASETEKVGINNTNEQIDNSTNLAKREIQHSKNVENLKQLSDQLAQMIEPSYDYDASGSITDLEKRNIELAASLETERLQSHQLHAINTQLQARISQLEAELSSKASSNDLHTAQDVLQLRGELQNHLQTIGLLVAEKTELASNLSQYELACKQKTTECEELQARLKASRGRVADMERELGSLKSEKVKSEGLGEQCSNALENLRKEYKCLKDHKDELCQDLLEVREKLKNVMEENIRWQQENKDLKSKLSLAEIKIQQFSSGGSVGFDHQIDRLTQEKFSLQSEIASLNQRLKSIINERDESTVQYQQYAQQLNAQILNLSSKLEQIQQEKERLVGQEQERIKHIGALEKQLQNLQNDQVAYATRSSSSVELKTELDKARELSVQLHIEKTTAEENFTKVSNEKELLLKELDAKMDSISQLESLVEQLKGNQPDAVKLLATMESDKVAASVAIQQNKEIKQQLEGMQEVVLKLDNDKVELTENLRAQQQTNKDLIEKLQKTESMLQSMADAIEIKDHELTKLRETTETVARQALTHEQLEDRLRHYEAHDHSAHVLQQELLEARQTITKLKSQRETEGDLEEARRKIAALSNDVDNTKNSEDRPNDTEDRQPMEDVRDTNENLLNKENVTKFLEEKVKKTMQEIADLTDEKQRLEHIVMQLQGETETIGEYVALYQHQRMVLKQRAVEKDQQLKQLADDREQVKAKLDKLNQLIRRIVDVPKEVLEEHSRINETEHNGIVEPRQETGREATNDTAEEIMNLLTEIKSSNLVEPDENFHHCPWCSGQLMTV